jgi:PAT family beta-lactamase induction signal transducer AmpG
VLAERVGWPGFFLFTVAASLPAFLLLAQLAPWNRSEAFGSFDPSRDAT